MREGRRRIELTLVSSCTSLVSGGWAAADLDLWREEISWFRDVMVLVFWSSGTSLAILGLSL